MMLGEAKDVASVYTVNAVKVILLIVLTSWMTLAEAACVDERVSNCDLRFAIYWMILLAPILVGILRIKSDSLISFILGGQVVGYLYYESGISADCNIRADFVFAVISIMWMIYRLCSSKE